MIALTGVQGLMGVALIAVARPREIVHVVYGAFAIIFLPGVYFWAARGSRAREAALMAASCWIVAIAYGRGILTGGWGAAGCQAENQSVSPSCQSRRALARIDVRQPLRGRGAAAPSSAVVTGSTSVLTPAWRRDSTASSQYEQQPAATRCTTPVTP